MTLELDIDLRTYVREYGNCRDADFTRFFPQGEGGGRARNDGTRKNRTAEELGREVIAEYCSTCPVTAECLELGLSYGCDTGHADESVWGGTLRADRVVIRQARKIASNREEVAA